MYSREQRPVELVTISSKESMGDKVEVAQGVGVFPTKSLPNRFEKIGVFVSARVHPGEVPASHVMNGIIKFLVSDDPCAELLRSKCVFYMVPIINPDGVDNGLYRSDSQGQNLNRHYLTPSP